MNQQHYTRPETLPAACADFASLVAAYDSELDAERSRLLEDRNLYLGKLEELKRLDPLDFTGLQQLYTAHVAAIDELLDDFSDTGN